MKRPLAVKSPTFTLKGLRQVQMEFFPDGHNNAPEGKARMLWSQHCADATTIIVVTRVELLIEPPSSSLSVCLSLHMLIPWSLIHGQLDLRDQAVLRLFFPPNAHMRFQCWLGRITLGTHEFKPGGGLSRGP